VRARQETGRSGPVVRPSIDCAYVHTQSGYFKAAARRHEISLVFSTTYLSRQTPHHRDPRETWRPKLSLAMRPLYLLGIVDQARLPLLLFPPVPSQAICATREQPLAACNRKRGH
jgi:hypothetical protein